MNKFAIVSFVALLAITCCVAEQCDLIGELDAYIESKPSRKAVETAEDAKNWVKQHVDCEVKAPEGFEGLTKDQFYDFMDEAHSGINKLNGICTRSLVNNIFKINRLHNVLNKQGKFYKAIAEYFPRQYKLCKREFANDLELKNNESLEGFMNALTSEFTEFCLKERKTMGSLWRYKCAARIEEFDVKKVAQVVKKSLEEKAYKSLTYITRTKYKKEELPASIGGAIDHSLRNYCATWSKLRFHTLGSWTVDIIMATWTRMAEIFGEETPDIVVKSEGYSQLCKYLANKSLLKEVAEITWGKYPKPN